jgi:hypothetical protein
LCALVSLRRPKRIAYLKGCLPLAHFKDWDGHAVSEWLGRVAATAALAGLLQPFTRELSDDERLAKLIGGRPTTGDAAAGDEAAAGKAAGHADGKQAEAATAARGAAPRPDGPLDPDREPVLPLVAQIQQWARPYDLTPPAARFGRIRPATDLKVWAFEVWRCVFVRLLF